jgi:carboxypeptidase C (cathepsin A)
VRNAGHMVPYDQPKWSFDLINRFTSGKPFV